jgi:hypothetical protein
MVLNGVCMMRAIRSALAIVLLSVSAFGADNSPGEDAIRSLLVKPKTWTMYLEFTDAAMPSDRAQKMIWEYFQRDQKVMGRRVGLAFGGCDLELSLRSDGFSFRWCPPLDASGPSLVYDPSDPQYPFKGHGPQKIWLKANE